MFTVCSEVYYIFSEVLSYLLLFEKKNGLWEDYGLRLNVLLFTRDDFNIKVLQAFVELHEFADLNLVQALRSAE